MAYERSDEKSKTGSTKVLAAKRIARFVSRGALYCMCGRIADEELAELKAWLEKKWNATPRDTALLLKLLRHLPGGTKLTQWSEAAPSS